MAARRLAVGAANQRMKLTGAAILVSRGMNVLQAAPAAYPYRSMQEDGMTDETPFLRAILAKPGDATTRLVYADWLEERGDPRSPFLRLDPEVERISYVAWLERDGHLDYYLQN